MIRNASFELPAPSDAAAARDWTDSAVSTAEESASFAGNDVVLPKYAYESYELGWGHLPQVFITNLDADPHYLDHLPFETMSFWSINQVVMTLGALEAASFNLVSTTFETFEEWQAMIDTDFVLADSELQSSGTDTFEWGATLWTMPSTESLPAETFIVRAPQVFYVQENALHISGGNYVGAQDDIVTFESTGKLPVVFTEDYPYYVFAVAGAAVDISATPRNSNGHALSINDSGTGVHRIVGDPSKFWVSLMP